MSKYSPCEQDCGWYQKFQRPSGNREYVQPNSPEDPETERIVQLSPCNFVDLN